MMLDKWLDAYARMSWALSELWAVLGEWVTGQGHLIGLIVAWFQVITGRVVVQ